MQEIPKADLATFEPLNDWWGRDARSVYCAGSAIRDANVGTFQVLNTLYARDARNAYTIKGPIQEADAPTFAAVGPTEHAFNATNGYAKDAHFVYHTTVGGKACVLKGVDPNTFVPLGNGYGADKSAVYFERKKLTGAEPVRWRHIRGPHSRSGKNAYVLGRRIRNANGERLESLPILNTCEYWSRDDKGFYFADGPRDPQEYLNAFRQCFIFVGKVSKVSLTWNQTYPLDPAKPQSWDVAEHAWIYVDCKEWIQKPDLEVVEVPRLGEPFKFGEGLRLRLLADDTWTKVDRIWIFATRPDLQQVDRLALTSTGVWWEYYPLNQVESIRRLMSL